MRRRWNLFVATWLLRFSSMCLFGSTTAMGFVSFLDLVVMRVLTKRGERLSNWFMARAVRLNQRATIRIQGVERIVHTAVRRSASATALISYKSCDIHER